MASAVVAVFDEYAEAQSTMTELIGAGFDQSDVKLNASGLLDDHDSQAYDEASRHGHYVVTAIAASDERTELASEVMGHHHTVGLDESASGVRVFHDVYEKPVEADMSDERQAASAEDDRFREHFERNYANGDGRYDAWVPAYKYGSSARTNQRFAGRDWGTVEAELKSDWEKQYPESKWERFKEAVKHAFSFEKD